MGKCCDKTIKPIDISVTSGVSLVITIPPQYLKNGEFFDLLFCLSKPDLVKFRDLVEGIETVTVVNGIGGTAYVLEDKRGNIFYSDLLHINRRYRLVWGNNGPAATDGTTGLVAHFLCLDSPCCARGYDPANTAIPTAETEA